MVTARSLVIAFAAAACSELPVIPSRDASVVDVDVPAAARRFVRLRSRADHTCALDEDGGVWCWGRDEDGQVGDGQRVVGRAVAFEVPGVRATDVWTGYASSCAACADGLLRCWGRNTSGELGDGTNVSPRLSPVVVRGVADVIDLALGSEHACALLRDHTVRCWGSDRAGALGGGRSGARPTVTPASLIGGVDAVGAGALGSCALGEGRVMCWGLRGNGELGDGVMARTDEVALRPTEVVDVDGASGLTVGDHGACVLLPGGAVRCWGDNTRGQVGDGTLERRWSPATPAVMDGVLSLHGGPDMRFARMSDGSILGWGAGTSGNFGGPERIDRVRPSAVFADLASRVRGIAAGAGHTCLLLSDGSVRCVGNNQYGQVGNGLVGGTVDTATPLRAPL